MVLGRAGGLWKNVLVSPGSVELCSHLSQRSGVLLGCSSRLVGGLLPALGSQLLVVVATVAWDISSSPSPGLRSTPPGWRAKSGCRWAWSCGCRWVQSTYHTVLAQEELTLRTRVQGLHSRAVLTALLLSGWPWDSCGR